MAEGDARAGATGGSAAEPGGLEDRRIEERRIEERHAGPLHYAPARIREILKRTKTIACVGVSMNETRPSAYVTRYLKAKGFRTLPINPGHAGATALGETVRARLADIPDDVGPVHMVDVFRRSEAAGAVVDEALEALADRGLETIWMQIGVIDRVAAARAEARGIDVIMDRCPKIEYARHFGELGWGGFNTGLISSKLP